MSAVTQNVISLSSVYLRGRTFLISVFLILIHLDLRHAFAVQWEVKNFPNPQTDLQDCGRRGKQSFVCDPDGVLSYSEADEIDRVIKQVRNSTGFCICGNKCPTTRDYRGIQPAVALVKKMYVKAKKPGKPTSKEKKKAADDFSDDLRDDRWEYGRCNDDFVIFISTEDRQVYTAVGDKTREMFLSDYCVNTVFNDVKRFFSGKKWAKGIEEMLKAYIAVYRREQRCNKPGEPPSKFTLIILGVLGATGIGSCCLCVFLRQKYGLCKCLDGAGGGGGGSSAKYSSPKHHHHHGGSKRRGSQDSVSSGGGGGEF